MALAKLGCHGLLVLHDLKEVLRGDWLERGHEGDCAGYLARDRIFRVKKLGNHHVCCAEV